MYVTVMQVVLAEMPPNTPFNVIFLIQVYRELKQHF